MRPEAAWPGWVDRLPLPADGSRRAEGGCRLLEPPATSAPGQPLISYVTVVRNACGTLARTLKSVRQQDWPRVEHIVVDGLSSDGTLAIIEAHAAQIDYYVSEADRGLYDALNKAIPLARGQLICVLNADDWLTPDAARLAARAHLDAGAENSRLVLSAAWAERGLRKKFWSPGRLDLGAYLYCANVCHNGVYATREAYLASGPYATHLRIAADFRWLMSCVDAGVALVVQPKPTVHYAMGGLSGDTRLHTSECAQILGERFPFLTEPEVWGLMHAFHVFRHNLEPFASARPPEPGRFLDSLTHAHQDQPDFQQALALAGIGVRRHADGDVRPIQLSRLQRTRRSLYRLGMRLRTLWVG